MVMMWLITTGLAGDIWQTELDDGTLVFTDSPQHSGYTQYHIDGPPPERTRVSSRSFPLLDTWDYLILQAAHRYYLEAELIKSVVLAESGMNPRALSSAGAMGLMQLMPGTAKDLGVTDPWDPEQNIDGGSRYIREQLDNFGDVRRAIAAYHAGPGNVRRYGGIPPFEATRIYVARVLDLYEMFRTERPLSKPESR
ncbi:MAG: soluble lytic murein transglycosylase-like protein [Myxococcota bacterium]|jgi:soluble lytic murein transglycosylase-like protein